MSIRLPVIAAVAVLGMQAGAEADVITGTYTAVDTGSGPYLPTINDDGGPFLNSPFSQTLTVGTTTAPITFLQVAPISGGSNVGIQAGAIAIDMKLLGPSASPVTSVTSSVGGVTLSNGTVDFTGHYEFFYSNQTDCFVWNGATCVPSNAPPTLGETLTVGFADNAKLQINLYNTSDWNLEPPITFDLLQGAGPTVLEPATLALFASGLTGLALVLRRRRPVRPASPA